MTRALVIAGGGRFADPWHPFARTGALLAGILEGEGFDAELTLDPDDGFARLADVPLLVLDIGDPAAPDPERDPAIRDALTAHLERGGSVLSMHVTSTSLRFAPEWQRVVGGVWVYGTTMHPDFALSHVEVRPDAFGGELVESVTDFDIEDEMYSYLAVDPMIEPLLVHRFEGAEHPLLWARRHGAARVVYDALGHDEHSYESPEHRAILRRAARWLSAGDAGR